MHRFGTLRHSIRRRSFVQALALGVVLAPAMVGTVQASQTAHGFTFTSIDGDPLPMDRFKGKAVLVVNTASHCGFTHQYEGLQALWDSYRDRGLVVLGVPSNDFGGQEPGTEAEIKAFCSVNFSVDFPMTEKVRVVGSDAHPLYQWMADQTGGQTPRWNFTKYLITPDGAVVDVFPSRVGPQSQPVIAAVERVLPE